MPIEIFPPPFDKLSPVVTYPHDAVLDRRHVAAALGIGEDAVDGLHLPAFGVGARQRFLWHQVLDVLAERALPTARDEERAAARQSIRRRRE